MDIDGTDSLPESSTSQSSTVAAAAAAVVAAAPAVDLKVNENVQPAAQPSPLIDEEGPHSQVSTKHDDNGGGGGGGGDTGDHYAAAREEAEGMEPHHQQQRRNTTINTANDNDDLEIDDVMNFLSPSPRRFPPVKKSEFLSAASKQQQRLSQSNHKRPSSKKRRRQHLLSAPAALFQLGSYTYGDTETQRQDCGFGSDAAENDIKSPIRWSKSTSDLEISRFTDDNDDDDEDRSDGTAASGVDANAAAKSLGGGDRFSFSVSPDSTGIVSADDTGADAAKNGAVCATGATKATGATVSGSSEWQKPLVNPNTTQESLSGLKILDPQDDDDHDEEIEILLEINDDIPLDSKEKEDEFRIEIGDDDEEGAIEITGHHFGMSDLLNMSLEEMAKSFDLDSSDDGDGGGDNHDHDGDDAETSSVSAPFNELLAEADHSSSHRDDEAAATESLQQLLAAADSEFLRQGTATSVSSPSSSWMPESGSPREKGDGGINLRFSGECKGESECRCRAAISAAEAEAIRPGAVVDNDENGTGAILEATADESTINSKGASLLPRAVETEREGEDITLSMTKRAYLKGDLGIVTTSPSEGIVTGSILSSPEGLQAGFGDEKPHYRSSESGLDAAGSPTRIQSVAEASRGVRCDKMIMTSRNESKNDPLNETKCNSADLVTPNPTLPPTLGKESSDGANHGEREPTITASERSNEEICFRGEDVQPIPPLFDEANEGPAPSATALDDTSSSSRSASEHAQRNALDLTQIQPISDSSLATVSLNSARAVSEQFSSFSSNNSGSVAHKDSPVEDLVLGLAGSVPPCGKEASSIDWRTSWNRFTKASLSVASTVAHATDPVLPDVRGVADAITRQTLPKKTASHLEALRREGDSYASATQPLDRLSEAAVSGASSLSHTLGPVLASAKSIVVDTVDTVLQSEERSKLGTESDSTVPSERNSILRREYGELADETAEVKSSDALGRFTKAMVSAASTMVHSTGPIFVDAESLAVELFAKYRREEEYAELAPKVILERSHQSVAESSDSLNRFAAVGLSAATTMTNAAAPVVAEVGNVAADLLGTFRDIAEPPLPQPLSTLAEATSPTEKSNSFVAPETNEDVKNAESSDSAHLIEVQCKAGPPVVSQEKKNNFASAKGPPLSPSGTAESIQQSGGTEDAQDSIPFSGKDVHSTFFTECGERSGVGVTGELATTLTESNELDNDPSNFVASGTSQENDGKILEDRSPSKAAIVSASPWMRFSAAAASAARSATNAAAPILSDVKMVAAEIIDKHRDEAGAETTRLCSTDGVGKAMKHQDTQSQAPVNSGRLSPVAEPCVDFVGPLSPPHVGRSKAEIFRRRSPLTPKERVPPLDLSSLNARLKRGPDVGSVSSVSSTMSPGSASKGFLPSGLASPLFVDEGPSLSSSLHLSRHDHNSVSKPPLFPRKSKDMHDNPKQFVEFLSKKLVPQEAEDSLEKAEGENKWMRSPMPSSFDARESVFAVQADSPLSPPGSPPVPDHSSDFDDGETVWEDSGGCVRKESAPPEKARLTPSPNADDSRPAHFVVAADPTGTPKASGDVNLMEWGMSSLATFASDSSKRSRGRRGSEASFSSLAPDANSLAFNLLRRQRSDVSISSSRKRRTPIRKLSQASRGSGRFSTASRGLRISLQGQRENSLPIRNVVSEGLSLLRPPLILTEEEDAMSTGAHSFSHVTTRTIVQPQLLRKSFSVSDLSQFAKSPSAQDTTSRTVVDPREKDTPALPAADVRSHQILLAGTDDEQHTVSLPAREEALLEEALVTFSSVAQICFPFQAPADRKISTRWRQLVASWKHLEVSKALNLQHPSDHFVTDSHDDRLGQEWSEASPASVFPSNRGELEDLELHGASFYSDIAQPDMKNLDGFAPHLGEANVPALSSFLTTLGRQRFWNKGTTFAVRHNLPSNAHCSSAGSHPLHALASAQLKAFTTLIEDLVSFTAKNQLDLTDDDVARTWFSVGVKDADAVDRKAARKYGGDCLQVKDVLRASVVFPNEGSLVCGLIGLFHRERKKKSDKGPEFTVVRLKNLFRCDGALGALVNSNLPTGYRHVLITIRLDCGLLAEIQCQLAKLYDILGEDGYGLHREISDLNQNDRDNDLIARVVIQSSSLDYFQAKLQCSKRRGVDPLSMKGSDVSDQEGDEEPSASPRRDESSKNEPGQSKTSREVKNSDSNLYGDCRILLSLLEEGAQRLASNPRDVPSFYCVYGLLTCVFENSYWFQNLPVDAHKSLGDRDQLVSYATRCLLRCLTISYQSTSTGMTGWMEYGSSCYSDRVVDRPFALLQNLAYVFASNGKWREAEDVLQANVLRCEQQLPLYHPLTIVTILDLAGAASANSRTDLASNLVALATRRFAFYLSEMEGLCFNRLQEVISSSYSGNSSFFIDRDRGPFSKLKAFIALLQYQSNRKILSVLGAWHEITLFHHCLLGDSTAVMANCVQAADCLETNTTCNHRSAEFWRLAYCHYKIAFEGFSQTRGCEDTAVYTTAYGLARCMRETGQTKQALRVLSSLVGNTEEALLRGEVDCKSDSELKQAPNRFKGKYQQSRGASSRITNNSGFEITREMSLGLCFWLLAVLCVDGNLTALGRSQSLRYLRASSMILQLALKRISSSKEEGVGRRRAKCVELLRTIEEEARRLLDGMSPVSFRLPPVVPMSCTAQQDF